MLLGHSPRLAGCPGLASGAWPSANATVSAPGRRLTVLLSRDLVDSGGARGCRPPPRSAIADVYYLKSILYAGTVGAGHRVHSPHLDSPRTPIPHAPTLCALHGTGARSGTARDGSAEWRPYGMAPGTCSGYKTCLPALPRGAGCEAVKKDQAGSSEKSW